MQLLLQRLERIADAAPGLGRSSRVMDVGSGPGTLIPHLQVTYDSCKLLTRARLLNCHQDIKMLSKLTIGCVTCHRGGASRIYWL